MKVENLVRNNTLPQYYTHKNTPPVHLFKYNDVATISKLDSEFLTLNLQAKLHIQHFNLNFTLNIIKIISGTHGTAKTTELSKGLQNTFVPAI